MLLEVVSDQQASWRSSHSNWGCRRKGFASDLYKEKYRPLLAIFFTEQNKTVYSWFQGLADWRAILCLCY
jgi:hypothetical protein